MITALEHVFNVCVEKNAILQILQLLEYAPIALCDIHADVCDSSVLAALISAVLKLLGGNLEAIIAQLVGLLGQILQLILSLKFSACAKVLLLA